MPKTQGEVLIFVFYESEAAMFKINKISSFSAVDYAAEELRKYLRMMMPECGNIEIKYDPCAKDGFRLGLMQDFGLDVSDAKEPELDDILYIDTDAEGGIIAGDNPRSVLLSVYEYLRQNGCRWLMPGVDGEFIPMQDIVPVKYRHKPTSRYRGWCNEGSEYQSDMLDAIDFVAKVGMNIFMIEFFTPLAYYQTYYNHAQNTMNRTPEPVSRTQVLQWKRQCESEIARRGLMFHDIGHGWTTQPFGIDADMRIGADLLNASLSDEEKRFLALCAKTGGKRAVLRFGTCTQFCMSNPDARSIAARFVADYAMAHSNSDYLHVWLADDRNNHCECDECKKKIPTDYYVMWLNEIDEELTKRKLDTRVVFIAYRETAFAPETVTLKNPDRFALLFAPSGRRFSIPLSKNEIVTEAPPYKRNDNAPMTTSETVWHLKNWMKVWKGANLAYEYHFYRHFYYDMGGISLAKIVNDDVKFYEENNIHGVIEDGSQRCFFPTGLAFYTYARTLYDSSLSADEIKEDYFRTAFGDDWRKFADYLEKLGNTFGHEYFSSEANIGTGRSEWYNPEKLDDLKYVKEVVAEGRKLIAEHYNSDYRVRTVSVRLLEFHADYAEMFADALISKCVGDDALALEKYERMRAECGRRELEFERWYDHAAAFTHFDKWFRAETKKGEQFRDFDE